MDSARVSLPTPQLKAAIIKAGSAAGVDITGLTADDNLPSLSQNFEESLSPPVVGAASLIVRGPDVNAPTTLAASGVDGSTVVQCNTETPQHLYSRVKPTTAHYYGQTGCMSHRFDYGLWLGVDNASFQVNNQPPIDIVPYLGTRTRTIAGRILGACLDYARACLLGTVEDPISTNLSLTYPPALPPTTAARAFFDHSLRHAKPFHDIVYVAALVKERVEFLTLRFTQNDQGLVHEGSYQIRKERVLESFVESGDRRDQWWTLLQVERHIGDVIGTRDITRFQTALGRKEEALMQVLQLLARDLA